MTNLTLSIEEKDLRQARIRALQNGTSLNHVVREFIKSYVEQNDKYQRLTEQLLKKANTFTFDRGDRTWTRGDLYER